MDYEKDIVIDENSLDLEWLEQPALMMKYSRHAAKMRREIDEVKQNLDIVKAEVDQKIRKNPGKYKIEKVTEGAISSAILVDNDYQEAYSAYLDAKYEADIAQSAVYAFEQRKSALENLVRLHGQQYFAGPKVPRDLNWEREERRKKVDAGVASKMTRSRNGKN